MTTATVTTPTTTELEPAAVLALSRCDRCGAAGKTLVTLPSGTDLVFCGHHTAQYETALAEQTPAAVFEAVQA